MTRQRRNGRCARRMLQLVAALALVGLLGGCGGDDEDLATGSTAGSVEITTEVDFSEEPFSGTFEVTEGADALGCATGTFVDSPRDEEIEKTFTCTDGSRDGTFTALITLPSEEEEQTPWRVVEQPQTSLVSRVRASSRSTRTTKTRPESRPSPARSPS